MFFPLANSKKLQRLISAVECGPGSLDSPFSWPLALSKGKPPNPEERERMTLSSCPEPFVALSRSLRELGEKKLFSSCRDLVSRMSITILFFAPRRAKKHKTQ